MAIFQLKILASNSIEAKSTRGGDEIKNENVVPIGNPADVKPINKGIDEQEQNGVTVPNSAANVFAVIPLYFPPNIFLVLSGGKKSFVYRR